MFIKKLIYLAFVGGILAACDNRVAGIESLGFDFVQAFSKAPNDEPLDASTLALIMTPTAEPFNC